MQKQLEIVKLSDLSEIRIQWKYLFHVYCGTFVTQRIETFFGIHYFGGNMVRYEGHQKILNLLRYQVTLTSTYYWTKILMNFTFK